MRPGGGKGDGGQCDTLVLGGGKGDGGQCDTLVLDNARYQRNSWVQQAGDESGIEPAVSAELFAEPEPDRTVLAIDQLRRLCTGDTARISRRSEPGSKTRCGRFGTSKEDEVKSMMTLKFQTFTNVSLQAA